MGIVLPRLVSYTMAKLDVSTNKYSSMVEVDECSRIIFHRKTEMEAVHAAESWMSSYQKLDHAQYLGYLHYKVISNER